MPFDIPNYAGATHPFQSAPDSVDFETITAGSTLTGVVSGCAVTAQGTPDMTVAVASGQVAFIGVAANVTAHAVVTIGAADPTNPRIDMVVVDNADNVTVAAGTAAAVPECGTPAANRVVLAMVYVPAAATTIPSTQITDKRVAVLPFGTVAGTIAQGQTAVSPCYIVALAVALG